jgi:hypothetical protein
MTAVDPYNIPKLMTRGQLEYWILFGICVAGKSAKQTEAKLNAFLDAGVASRWEGDCIESPFCRVKFYIRYKQLGWRLRHFKMGQYKRINKAFRAAVNLDLDNVSIESLEKVPGLGPKTARMTMLYYDPNAQCIPLDTHILKWLRANGYDAPKSTPPSGKKYRELELAFLAEGKKRGLTPQEWDTRVWKTYAKG